MSNLIPLRIALTPDRPKNLPLPSYAHPGDAGLDLVAMEEAWIGPMGYGEEQARRLIRTGVRVEIPAGHVGLVCPRSGLASREGVVAVLGVIDEGFTGEVKVNLMNHGRVDHDVEVGQRIAQLLIVPISRAVLEVVDDLSASSRGEAGFGSTGR